MTDADLKLAIRRAEGDWIDRRAALNLAERYFEEADLQFRQLKKQLADRQKERMRSDPAASRLNAWTTPN